MQSAAVRERLLADRKANGASREILTGKKLAEAAAYLKNARTALVGWTREVYANSDALDLHLVHVQEMLSTADNLEKIAGKIQQRAEIFGQ